ncbi:DNA cytosine methyltransferase, partial [Enterococcus faecalis]|nr:DNA cytosine methyltransferase [Enterococcus faecalis]
DMEMVQSVSPGGNWKEIPVEVAQKSKRLMRIRETGGRTTLYGRLDYSKPSYTITTYFNRPGNGTNIHPNLDRVLSVREAARIQGFPDDYYFYGNKKNKLNQIGNAVPPLIAYQIAKSIKKHIDVKNSLDLFSGAGGMTNGFKQADYYSVLMNDIDEAALITAKVNYPQSTAFLGDLTIKANRNYIINFAINNNVDIINGGPPCQGFSMAGFRNSNDPRSKLIYDYVAVLKEVKPKVFVFENVQGLLSHNKGKTFKNLLQLFLEVGYVVEARLMDFSDYGVP